VDFALAFAVFVAVTGLRGLLARDVPLAFGFALLFVIMPRLLDDLGRNANVT
jgi:hypothetical protein